MHKSLYHHCSTKRGVASSRNVGKIARVAGVARDESLKRWPCFPELAKLAVLPGLPELKGWQGFQG